VLTPTEAVRQLELLSAELRSRQSEIELHDRYYAGHHRLRFASDEFARHFEQRYSEFSDNWVQVVADAPTERLEITGFRPDGMTDANDELWKVWQLNDADGFSDQAMLEAILHRRAFSLTWGNPSDEDVPDVTFEHPSQAIVGYDPGTRRARAGLKLWIDDPFDFATLYTPDAVWKFQRRTVQPEEHRVHLPPGVRHSPAVIADGWEPREIVGEPWPLPNPMGVVPLVEWENRPRLAHDPMSDVAGAIAMQDAINLLWAYLFNTADFASFPQRLVMGQEKPTVPVLDDQGVEIGRKAVDLAKFGVDRVVWLEDPNAKVGQWDAADLGVFTEVIKQQVEHLAAQTRTPHHYLVGKMANLSADALKASETGLVKRTEEKQPGFGRGARGTAVRIALARGDTEFARAMSAGVVTWSDVEMRSRSQTVDELQKLKAMGVPLRFLLERYGLTKPEIDRVMEMRRDEVQQLLDGDAAALLDAAAA